MTTTPNEQPNAGPKRVADLWGTVGLPRRPYNANDSKIMSETKSGDLDPEETAAWFKSRAHQHFANTTPPRFRHAIANHPAVLDWVSRYLLDHRGVDSLLLLGPTGTGKTYQAYGAMRVLADSGRAPVKWRATTAAALYAKLRPGSTDDFETDFATWAGVPLLILDDLGAAKRTEFTEEVTYRLIDHRYAQRLPTIVTTNLLAGELRKHLGDRTASRLREMCIQIAFDNPDRRKPPAVPGE